jgi:hypothetical protein
MERVLTPARLAALGVALLIFAGCTTRTAGMQAPLPHDYDGIQWRPLDTVVAQPVVVAPAYTALVENDPGTDTRILRERIAALPDDVRGSQLIELRVAIRPAKDLNFDGESTLQVRASSSDEPLSSTRLRDLNFDGEWAIVDDLPSVDAGELLVIELRPGSVPSGWEFGYAAGLVPYGGEGAVLNAESEQPAPLGRALAFQTIFEQDTDAGAVIAAGFDSVADGLFGDALLLAIYACVLVTGLAVLVLRSPRYRKAGQGGR